MARSVEPLMPKRGCPICGKPRDAKYDPFCSKRCAEIDLSRWLKGVYAIPGAESDEDENSAPPDDDETRKT
jgi:endogenous inhibitor of DNA gyrase (YacG/DUF329 family)